MGVRETVDRNKPVAVGVTLVLLVAGVVLIYFNSQSNSTTTMLGPRSFFSDDDGKTWFVDAADKTPPFDHNGKTAHRARLFTSDGGKTQFVGYLERYTPESIKRLEAAKRGEIEPKGRSVLSVIEELSISGMEIKKPGTGNPWVARGDPLTAAKILDVKGAGNQPAEPVMP